MEENVIINIKIDGTENEAKIDSLTSSILDLQKANQNLAAQNKALAQAEGDNTKAIVENAKQIEINKQKISENSAQRKGLIQTIMAEDNSIKALSIRNAQLIKERNQINTATEEGRKRISAINAQIDANNTTIKENSSAMEKQRMNIGNYASALDKIAPGLSGFIQGVEGGTTAAKAFIATPLGATLAVVAGVLATVKAYFNSSEDAQNRWNKVVAFGTGLLERFMNIVEDVGGFLVDNFVKGLEAVGGVLDMFATSVGLNTQVVKDFFNEIGTEAKRFADLQATLDIQERNLLIKRAQTAKDVAKLRQEAISQEGEEKRKIIKEAIELERQLAQAEVDHAKVRESLAMAELKRNGDDKEAKKAVFQATADRINQEAEFYQATLRFEKELEKLNDADQKRIEKDIELLLQKRELQIEDFSIETELGEQRVELNASFEEAIFNTRKSFAEQNTKNAKEQAKLIVAIETEKQQKMATLGAMAINTARQLAGSNKALQSGLTLIDTYFSAQRAFASQVIPGDPTSLVRAIAAAALTTISGLARVAQINGIQFARGGIADTGGVLNGPSHAQGGIPFAVGGRLGFEAEGGEAIINKRSTAMFKPMLSAINQAGGGRAFAAGGITGNEVRAASQAAMGSFNASQMAGLINQVRTVLVLQDFETVQNSRNETVNRAEVIGA